MDFTDKWQEIISELKAQNSSAYLPPQYTGTLLKGFEAQKAILLDRLSSEKSTIMEIPFSGSSTFSYILQKYFSRGSLNIDPQDIYGEPLVDFQTLMNPVDVKFFVETFKYLRKWIYAPSNQRLGVTEGVATVNITTDDAIIQMLRKTVRPSIVHLSGTNAMMPLELGGVVGPDLLVHGVSHLSVVDASTMSLIPSTHLCATVYAIAEKVCESLRFFS